VSRSRKKFRFEGFFMNKQTTQQSIATGLPGSHLVSADCLLGRDDFHRLKHIGVGLNAKQERVFVGILPDGTRIDLGNDKIGIVAECLASLPEATINENDALDFIYANGGIEMRLLVPALGLCVNFLREIAKAGKNVSGYPPTTLAETVEDFLDSLSEEAQRELEQPHQPTYFEFEKEIR
jgi:hypothetical protein